MPQPMPSFARQSFDSSRFGDPVALQTEWKPLKGGGTNFRTHRLTKVNDRKVEFRPTKGTRGFSGIMMAFGIIIPVYHHIEGIVDASYGLFLGALIAWAFGGLFFWVGLKFWNRMKTVLQFDKQSGRFITKPLVQRSISLEKIHAIQLIRERMTSTSSSSKSSFTSYELNLVLHDASRVPVIDHSGRNFIRDDAKKLSGFLDVPLWDGM